MHCVCVFLVDVCSVHVFMCVFFAERLQLPGDFRALCPICPAILCSVGQGK